MISEKKPFPHKNTSITTSQSPNNDISLFSDGIHPEDVLIQAMIYVYNPIVIEGLQSYVQYTVGGKLLRDPIQRRFSAFFSLRQKLVERWPGLYIPGIPPKKVVGNLKKEVVQMRTRTLNNFCYKISQFKTITESEEMQVFLMKSAEPSYCLENLPQLSYSEILRRYKKAFPEYDESKKDLQEAKEKISNYTGFIKKAFINLTNFKEIVEQTMIKKDKEIENYITFLSVFEDYEKYAMIEYTDNDESKLVFYNPQNYELYQKILSLRKNLMNPYNTFNEWLEDEIIDFKAMTDSLASLTALNENCTTMSEKINKTEEKLNSLQSGFSKIKLMLTFKNRETAFSELNQVKESTSESLSNLKEIIRIATLYMADFLDVFKVEKLKRYHYNINAFTDLQKKNNHILNDLWECVSKNRNMIKNTDIQINNNK